MSYSRNFGMRSFENVVRDGRFRAPRTGTPLKIGAPVQLDAANAGFVEAAADAAAPGPNAGIAVYEHIQNKSDALTTQYDAPYDQVPNGQYVQVMHGPGTKVWFRNTADKVLYDGRTQTGDYLVSNGVGGGTPVAPTGAADLSTVAIGAGLVPDGAGRFRVADATESAWMVVEQVNPATGRVEARLTF
jgi:hypothetical protein